jgi:hypothetical protein
LALLCGKSLNVFAVGHDTPLGRVGVSFPAQFRRARWAATSRAAGESQG